MSANSGHVLITISEVIKVYYVKHKDKYYGTSNLV